MTRGLVDSTGGGTAEHQNQDYAPSHVLAGLLEFLDQLRDSQRDGEVIKGFPGPGDECYEEEEPIAGGVAIATAELDFGAFAIGGLWSWHMWSKIDQRTVVDLPYQHRC